MEVTISKQCMASALSRTSTIADRKSSMQILSNVLISAEGPKQIRFATTDLNMSAAGILPAQIVKGGSITLPAKTLYDIVRTLPDGPICLKTDGDFVEITSGRSVFKLIGLPAEDFPKLPDASGIEFFDMDSQMLTKMIERTSFSISSDETRPHINGALFQGDGKILRMVTTDGHRLSMVEFKTDESGFYNYTMVVPNRGIGEIRRLIDEGSGPISICSHDGSIFLRREIEVEKGIDGDPPRTAEFVLVCKLIDTEFPPYDQVIPKGQDKRVIVPRVALLEALKRVSVVSSERTLGVKFSLSEGSLEISTDNPSVGEGSEIIDVGYDGEELVIGFNARYYIDILNVLDESEVVIELSGDLDPAVIRDTSDNYVGVVMPMRI
jgi:DNA polymerase-3 subunit beta